MTVKKPLIYYDSSDLVKYTYGDMLLPSEVYHYLQSHIKSAHTVILPAGFFKKFSEDDNYIYLESKEYIQLYKTIHNEKGVRLFIEPILHDKELIPIIKVPFGIDDYIDKNHDIHDLMWFVVDYDRTHDTWIARKRIAMSLDDISYLTKIEKRGKTFFFGDLYLFPRSPYKIAFNDNEIDRALQSLPQDVCKMLSNTEKCWSWLLNYLDDVRVVYLFGKGHDVAVGYAVTDWEAYFVAGVVK
jgi:hypothetical protein